MLLTLQLTNPTLLVVAAAAPDAGPATLIPTSLPPQPTPALKHSPPTGARPAPSAYDDVDQQSFCEGSTLSAGAHQRQLQQQVPYLPPDDDQADDALDVNMGAGIVVADEAEAAGEGDMAAAAQQAAAAAADGAEAGALGLQAEGSEAGSVGDGPGGREVQGQQHQLGGGGSSRGQLTEY